jgi:hypothetical protein
MQTHLVELSEETELWAKARAEAEGFLTLSDYVASLVQQQKDAEHLRAALVAADPVPLAAFDDGFFAALDKIATNAA